MNVDSWMIEVRRLCDLIDPQDVARGDVSISHAQAYSAGHIQKKGVFIWTATCWLAASQGSSPEVAARALVGELNKRLETMIEQRREALDRLEAGRRTPLRIVPEDGER